MVLFVQVIVNPQDIAPSLPLNRDDKNKSEDNCVFALAQVTPLTLPESALSAIQSLSASTIVVLAVAVLICF